MSTGYVGALMILLGDATRNCYKNDTTKKLNIQMTVVHIALSPFIYLEFIKCSLFLDSICFAL